MASALAASNLLGPVPSAVGRAVDAPERACTTGLTKLGLRHYDPVLGAFTTPDPAGLGNGDAHVYADPLGDPINMRDAAGTQVFPGYDRWTRMPGTVTSVGGTLSLKAGEMSTGRFTNATGSFLLLSDTFALDDAALSGTSFDGGRLQPTSTTNVEGRLVWTAAMVDGPAALRVPADATLEIVSGQTVYLDSALDVGRHVGARQQHAALLRHSSGVPGRVATTETVTRVTGTGSAMIDGPVDNDGTVTSAGGAAQPPRRQGQSLEMGTGSAA